MTDGYKLSRKTKGIIIALSIFIAGFAFFAFHQFSIRNYSELLGARQVLPPELQRDLYLIDLDWTAPDALTLQGMALQHQFPMYVFDLTSSNITQITPDGQYSHSYSPSISPDGKLVAIRNYDAGCLQILENKEPWDVLFNVPVSGYELEWSQDGSRAAILDRAENEGITIYILNLGTRNILEEHHFTLDDEISLERMSWLEESNQIAAVGSRHVKNGDGSDDHRDIVLLSLNDNTIRQLTDTPDMTEDFPEWISDGILAYSIVKINRSEYSEGKLQINDIERGCVRTIEDIQGITNPVWSPDRKEMAFKLTSSIYILPFEHIPGSSKTIADWVCQ